MKSDDTGRIRLEVQRIAQAEWEAGWGTRQLPDRSNPGLYLRDAEALNRRGQLSDEDLNEIVLAYTQHPDETMVTCAMDSPSVLYLSKQAKEGRLRESEKRYLADRSSKYIERGAWIWQQALDRTTADLATHILTPLAGRMVAYAEWAAQAMAPRTPNAFGVPGRWSEAASRKSMDAARLLEDEQIVRIIENFAAWAQKETDWATLHAAAGLDNGNSLTRVAWEHSPLVFDEGKVSEDKKRQLLKSPEAMAGFFQNSQTTSEAIEDISRWIAARDTISAKKDSARTLESAAGQQFVLEHAAGGYMFSQETLKLLKALPRGVKGGWNKTLLRLLAMLPQLARDESIRKDVEASGDTMAVFRLLDGGEGGSWTHLAGAAARSREDGSDHELAQIVVRAGTRAEQDGLLRVAADGGPLSRRAAITALADRQLIAESRKAPRR